MYKESKNLYDEVMLEVQRRTIKLIDKETKLKFINLIRKIADTIQKFHNIMKKNNHYFGHGDLNLNNIMITYGNNEKEIDLRKIPVDFDLMDKSQNVKLIDFNFETLIDFGITIPQDNSLFKLDWLKFFGEIPFDRFGISESTKNKMILFYVDYESYRKKYPKKD